MKKMWAVGANLSCFIITSHSWHSEIISGGEGGEGKGRGMGERKGWAGEGKRGGGGERGGKGTRERGEWQGLEPRDDNLTTCKAIKTHSIMSSDDMNDVTKGRNDILLRAAVHFGLRKWAKIERNDGKRVRRWIDGCNGQRNNPSK